MQSARAAVGIALAVVLTSCSAADVERVEPPVDAAVDVAVTPSPTVAAQVPPTALAPPLVPTATPLPPTAAPTPTAAAVPPVDAALADPSALAVALTAAETAIRDPSTAEGDLPSWAHLQQIAYRHLIANPDWHTPARDGMPTELQPVFDANLFAGDQLSSLNRPRDELPEWRIVAPLPIDELRALHEATAVAHGLDWTYLATIHFVETRFGRIEGTSHAGAQGPMQFIPTTWAAYGNGGDVNNLADALPAAARYLLDHGAPGDMRRALWHYNPSDRYVDAVDAYASVLRADPLALRGYYHWQVYYRHVTGDLLLPEGWDPSAAPASSAG